MLSNIMKTLKKYPTMHAIANSSPLDSHVLLGYFTFMETWKDIKGYEGRYQVSNYGRVKSLKRYVNSGFCSKKTVNERVLKTMALPAGYITVMLGGGRKTHLVHRLVASTFIDNNENKPCINHLNGIKSDNREVNLQWCTYSENEKHSYRVLGKAPIKNNLGNTGVKAKDAKPVAFYSNGVLVCVYGSASEAARILNRHQGRISCNARGESKKCYGGQFTYITKTQYYELKGKI